MVGKLVGWLIYLPALPNWVSIFQNSIGGSRIMSVTLQDHIFPVAWFLICMKCPLHSMWTILCLGLHFKSHLPGCLFLKYTQSPVWKAGWSFIRKTYGDVHSKWKVSNLVNGPIPLNVPPPGLEKIFNCISEFRIKRCGMYPPVLASGGNLGKSTFPCTVQWCMQICHKPFSHHLRAIGKC